MTIARAEGDNSSYDLTLRPFRLQGQSTEVCFRRYRSGGWCVIEVAGEIDIAVAPAMHEVADGASSAEVVFDLEGVTFMDSAGAAVLADISRSVTSSGGSVRLVQPPPAVRRLLRLMHLDDAMSMYASVAEATV